VVVVGGGYGGATAAKYLRLLSGQRIDVTLVEPEAAFVSCPLSNLVIGGSKAMTDITVPYDTLERTHGVRRVRDRVERIDAEQRIAVLASGARLPYDKLVLSPGVELMWDGVAGLRAANEQGRILRPGRPAPRPRPAPAARGDARRRDVRDRDSGGPVPLPARPVRARLPGCALPEDGQAAVEGPRPRRQPGRDLEGALFKRVWSEAYPGIVEYRPQHKATAVDAAAGVVRFEVQDDVRATC
jgi:hypothetical protein